MAHIYVKNSLSNLKAAKVDLNLPMFVTTDSNGEPIWVLEVATTYPSVSGTRIRPSYINKVTSFEELDSAVAEAVSEIASQIDWLPLVDDTDAPYIDDYRPEGSNVSIGSNVFIGIREDAPTAGIDLSEMEVTIDNGEVEFDITSECEVDGNPFEYFLKWAPPDRIYKRYDEE